MEKTNIIKMEIYRFDGKSNFSLWQARVKDVLIQQKLVDAHLNEKKLATIKEKTWEQL